MLYRTFNGLKISALGLGTMRLPVIDRQEDRIDTAKAEVMIDYALAHGINYIDTAWGYHGGNAEQVVGTILKKYPRDSYYLATKFPGYDLANMDKVEEIFEEQLKRTGMEYFDFYLIHNVIELNIDEYLNPQHGILPYLRHQKETGRIRHLGFSAHGSVETIRRFLEVYGADMEFCQLQINWADWDFQDAKAKVALIREYHLPIWVMEPMRGGKLANLEPEDVQKLKRLRPTEHIAAWAFRFLQSLPDAVVTLTGASSLKQLAENIRCMSEEKPTTAKENEVLFAIAKAMDKGVPCTGCGYCLDHCPQKLNIPLLLALYNEELYTGGGFLPFLGIAALSPDMHPDACTSCRSCTTVCPQQLDIPAYLSDFTERLKIPPTVITE